MYLRLRHTDNLLSTLGYVLLDKISTQKNTNIPVGTPPVSVNVLTVKGLWPLPPP